MAAKSPHSVGRKAGCRAAAVPVVFAESKNNARALCSPSVSVPEPDTGTAATHILRHCPWRTPHLWCLGALLQRVVAHTQNASEGVLAFPGDSWHWVSPQPWCHLWHTLITGLWWWQHWRSTPLPVPGWVRARLYPCSGFLSVRADYSAKAAMWQSCLHCFTELGCLLSPSTIFRAGNRILMVEVQIRFSCRTLTELAARGTCWLCREQDHCAKNQHQSWVLEYISTPAQKLIASGLHFELLVRDLMLQERDAKKTDLTLSLASTKGRTGVKWWLFPFISHLPELYPPDKSRCLCTPLFSWAQGRSVICAAPAEAMLPVQYQTARDHHHARASIVRWARNSFFYSFAGGTIFYLTSCNNHFCSDMGLQFDVHLYTPCMLSLLFKIILQLIHLLLTHYLSLNKDVLLFAVAAYSAQRIVGWYFPSLITRAIWFIITRIALTLLTNKSHCPWLQQLLEQMKRPSVCIPQQLWELALPPTFLFQMSGASEMCQGFRVVITSIWAENKLL